LHAAIAQCGTKMARERGRIGISGIDLVTCPACDGEDGLIANSLLGELFEAAWRSKKPTAMQNGVLNFAT
jgi:hypothetical protein